MTDTKNECVESITRALERSSVWRKSLAARFPEDGRNLRAAQTLENLAIDAADMTDEQFTTLSSHYGWASEKWRSALNDTARGIGFHIRTRQFDIFLKALLQRLAPVVSVAA
jgi:hypothetical protein